MLRLDLSPQEVAAAARIHKGTLYKILAGETENPHHSTLRRICKAVGIDFASVVGSEQLELLNQKADESGTARDLEGTLVKQLRRFTAPERALANHAAAARLADVQLAMVSGSKTRCYTSLRRLRRSSATAAEGMLVRQLRRIPPAARSAAVQAAVGILLDLHLLSGAPPCSETYSEVSAIRRLRNSGERPKRTTLTKT